MVRPALIIITLAALAACKNKHKDKLNSKPWTEEQKHKFYADNLSGQDNYFSGGDTSINFVSFMDEQYPELKAKNKYDPFIYALEEFYIDTTRIDTAKHWIRITVEPCFRKPYCLILEKKDDKSILTTKITSGDGGYYPGVLIATTRFQFGDTLYDAISDQLSLLDFWNLGKDTSCHGGFDGEIWIFEAIEKRKYNMVERWVPQGCGNDNTTQLSRIGIMLAKLGRLDNILEAIGERKSDLQNYDISTSSY